MFELIASDRGTEATLLPSAGQLVASVSDSQPPLFKTGIGVSAGKGFTFIASGGNRDQFVRVGHCLFARLAAHRPRKADARFEHGVLTLTLPKSERAKPRQIKVGAAGAPEPGKVESR